MRKFIQNLLCVTLVLGIIVPDFAFFQTNVNAANEPIPLITVLVEKSDFTYPGFSSVTASMEEQLADDARNDLLYSPNKWLKLYFYDKLSWGEIHRRVQDDIWANVNNNVEVGELPIKYDLNSPNIYKYPELQKLKASKSKTKKGATGRADVYSIQTLNNNVFPCYYLWEVKPDSYDTGKENCALGERQIKKYVDTGTPINPNSTFALGEPIANGSVNGNTCSFNLSLLCANTQEIWEEEVQYDITYKVNTNSLIIYDFERNVNQKNKLQPGTAPVVVTQADLDAFRKLVDDYKKTNDSDTVATFTPSISYELIKKKMNLGKTYKI